MDAVTTPAERVDEAAHARSLVVERRLGGLRLVALAAATALTPLCLRGVPGTVPWLAYTVLGLAWAYGFWFQWYEPYRGWPALRASRVTVLVGAAAMIPWVYATGGRASPFYVVLYPAAAAAALRLPLREGLGAAALYGGSYVALLAFLGQLGEAAGEVGVRVGGVLLAAGLGAVIAREVLAPGEHARAQLRAEQAQSRLAQEQAARVESEAAERAMAFLAWAGEELAASLDYETTLATVARLAVPELADVCAVDVLEGDGELKRLAVEHRDPAKKALLEGIQTASGGEGATAPDARGGGATAEALGICSSVAMPLEVRGRTLGVVSFGMAESGRRYGPVEVGRARELARRAALAVDNARLYRDAEEAIRARDEFLSIASHELRTPLSALVLQLEALARALRESAPGDAKLAARVDRAVRQTDRLARLIDSLLDVSRIVSAGLKLQREEFDLAEAVRDVNERFADEAARAGCALALRADGHTTGSWDRLRVEQVVTNLLSNAMKYGAGRPVEVCVEGGVATARITVQDHGIGIAREDVARIFGRFERAVSTRHYGGLGLGLYIARQIAEAHGGSIHVTSTVGEGASFTVELPREEPVPE